MVDLPQGPAGRPEKPQADPLAGPRQEPPPVRPILAEVVTQKPLPRPQLQPTPLQPMELSEPFGGLLPTFLGICGFLASAILFLTGVDCRDHQGAYFIGLAFFVGPVLFGIAGILHRLNQRKRD